MNGNGGGNRRKTGAEYEAAAAAWLETKGYRILERNYRTRLGEIDLIAEEGATLCFIEVKYRSGTGYGMPAEAVTPHKQQKILAVSRHYLTDHGCWERSIRYDVVEILGGRIRVLKNSFGG